MSGEWCALARRGDEDSMRGDEDSMGGRLQAVARARTAFDGIVSSRISGRRATSSWKGSAVFAPVRLTSAELSTAVSAGSRAVRPRVSPTSIGISSTSVSTHAACRNSTSAVYGVGRASSRNVSQEGPPLSDLPLLMSNER